MSYFFFLVFLLVCWDSASILRVSSINWRAAYSYKLKVDILTFPPDVYSKKKDIGYEILWDLYPDLNTDLAPTIICAFLYLLHLERWKDMRSITNGILFQEKQCL